MQVAAALLMQHRTLLLGCRAMEDVVQVREAVAVAVVAVAGRAMEDVVLVREADYKNGGDACHRLARGRYGRGGERQ